MLQDLQTTNQDSDLSGHFQNTYNLQTTTVQADVMLYSDNHNWKAGEIENFPIPQIDDATRLNLIQLYKRYLADIERKANIRISSGNSSYNVSKFKEYKIVKSKSIIDEIDDTIGILYGLTKEEIEFIKNYEIEFRMAGDN